MNWLDWTIVAVVALAALKGFGRGLVVEITALLAVVVGVWVGLRSGPQVVEAIGISISNALLAFMVTLVVVLVGAYLIARLVTGALDLTLLSIPNKLGGALFAALRTVFAISIMVGLLEAYTAGAQPSPTVRADSALYGPVRALAPTVLSPFGGVEWVKDAATRVREEAQGLIRHEKGTEE